MTRPLVIAGAALALLLLQADSPTRSLMAQVSAPSSVPIASQAATPVEPSPPMSTQAAPAPQGQPAAAEPDDATLNNTAPNDGEAAEARTNNEPPQGAVLQAPAVQQPPQQSIQQAPPNETLQSMDQHLDSIDEQTEESRQLQEQLAAMGERNVAIREAGEQRLEAYGGTLQQLTNIGTSVSYFGSSDAQGSLSDMADSLAALRANASQYAGQEENVWLGKALNDLQAASDAFDASDYVHVQYSVQDTEADLRRAVSAAGGTTAPR